MLIVVGVLIALLLESAWQDRAARSAERMLLGSLSDEFAANAESLDRWLQLHQRIAKSARQVITLLEDVPDGIGVSIPDTLIGELARTPTYGPEMSSLDAALNSGQISLIRSSETQRSLARWGRLLADAREEEIESSDFVRTGLLPHLSLVTDLEPSIDWLSSDIERIMQGLPAQARPVTASNIVVSRELVNLLWIRYRMASAAANELGLLKLDLNELLELLRDELG